MEFDKNGFRFQVPAPECNINHDYKFAVIDILMLNKCEPFIVCLCPDRDTANNICGLLNRQEEKTA